jgi:hypothetical protein
MNKSLERLKRNAEGHYNKNYFMLEEFRNSYNFRNPELSMIFDLIFAVLNNIEAGGLIFRLFKEDVLTKRDNPLEYYKALIKFAQE